MFGLTSKSFDYPILYEDIPENHPARLFHDYWRELCGDKKFALKSAFNPAAVPRLLSNIGIVKLDRSGPEFDLILTLAGERIKELSGITGSGSYRKSLFSGDHLTDRLKLYDNMAQNAEVNFFRMRVPFLGRDYIEIIKGMFPFSSDGKIVDYYFLVIEELQGKYARAHTF